MRILASNPDTIGDLMLRQPLYRALTDAGHELMLVVRPLVEPIVPLVAPGARVAVAPANLYGGGLEPGDPTLAGVAEAARAFEPDVLLVAPFQWTVLEERLALTIPRARCIAMTGRLFADPKFGPSPPSVIRGTVAVAEDAPELAKNEKLAAPVLGRATSLPEPRIEPGAAHRRAAEAELARLGLSPGGYWAACVGHTDYTAVRNWRAGSWAELLAGWARDHGRRFLLVGSAGESLASADVRRRMGDSGRAAPEWYGPGEGAIDTLIGLLALSRGYVGRDTGPMHLAAALGKPVLAVFGGGTWPRFLPAADPSVSITVGVPCSGCGWVCPLQDSYCVKDVPVAVVREAADALETGTVKDRVVRVLKADEALLGRIAREGAAAARDNLVQVSMARRRPPADGTKETDVIDQDPAGPPDESAWAVASTVEPKTFGAGAGSGGAEAARLREELAQTRAQLAQARARIAQLEANAAEALQQRAKQAAEIAGTRDYLVDVKARVTALEKKVEDRTAELMTAKADLAAAREHLRLESAARQQAESARGELDRAKAEIAIRVREAVAADQRIKGLTAQLEEATQFGSAEHRKRESQMIERINDFKAKLTAGEGRLADLRQQLNRNETDRAALARLTKQQEKRIGTLRARVHDLVASRWRRLGQRLHFAMELPWEKEYRHNGRP